MGYESGKHLTYLDGGDKKARLSTEAFELALEAL